MQATVSRLSFVVSPRAYAAILTSPALSRMLLPEGLAPSPYAILDYEAMLTLHDRQGRVATFRRTEQIRFLQEGVAAILDHIWGDGVGLTYYHNDAGTVVAWLRDAGRRHPVIALERAMSRGEELSFGVVRTAVAAFTRDEEWLETTLDHPAKQLSRSVIFPPERPCRGAVLQWDRYRLQLPVIDVGGGRTLVRFQVSEPLPHTAYTVRWLW